MSPQLPEDIRTTFFLALNGELELAAFETWLYAADHLERRVLTPEAYLALISIGYRLPAAPYELRDALRSIINAAEFEHWRLRRMLQQCLAGEPALAGNLRTLYHLYNKGYLFLQKLGLDYGLTIEVADIYTGDSWEALSPEARQTMLARFYPQIHDDLLEVLGWLDTGAIIITGPAAREGGYEDRRASQALNDSAE